MYKAVARVLDSHGIRYYIYYGTAIGAIRHDGFVPWDDDIDIAVWEEDLPLIEKVLTEELDPEMYVYEVQLADTHPHVFYKGDDYEQSLKDRTALFLDIFTIVRYPYGKIRHWLSVAAIWGIHISITAMDKMKSVSLYPHLIWIPRFFNRIASMLIQPDSEYCVVYTTHFQNEIFRREDYGDPVMHVFEDTEVPLPANVDLILRRMYGDYMVPPPEDERSGATGFPLNAYKDYMLRKRRATK